MDQRNNNFEIQWTDLKVSRLWNYYANCLPQNQYFSFHSGKYLLKALMEKIEMREKTILDFGCGPGYLIDHLLIYTGESTVYGLDFSSESVRIVKDKFKNHSRFGGAYVVDELLAHINIESIDVITCIEVMEHLNDDQLKTALELIYKLLKHGGKLAVTVPHQEDLEINKTICPDCGCIFHRWQHIRSWKPVDIEGWLKRAGFIPILVQPTHFQSSRAELLERIRRTYKFLSGQKYERTLPHLMVVSEKR
jgi:2-polyprenyl-3-methyl-5-hydroxy-6-metoxy-1,4-benzoquinol methylase